MSKVDLPWKDMNTITVLCIMLESDRPYQYEPNIQIWENQAQQQQLYNTNNNENNKTETRKAYF